MANAIISRANTLCAFDSGSQCAVLNEKRCGKCTFFKTEAELKQGRKKAEQLLAMLPKEQQKCYDEKYHSRKMRNY